MQCPSTITVFIGHAHSHSCMSHVSSMGQMYNLVREVVDMVCKLLTIVEAVMQHPALLSAKLRSAHEGLYSMTTALADAVRMLMSASAMSEEEEKATLLRSATGVLKVATDCIAAVKLFLNRTVVGDHGLVVHLPRLGQMSPVVSPRAKVVFEEVKGEVSPAEMLRQWFVEMEDEDMTIQAFTDAE